MVNTGEHQVIIKKWTLLVDINIFVEIDTCIRICYEGQHLSDDRLMRGVSVTDLESYLVEQICI